MSTILQETPSRREPRLAAAEAEAQLVRFFKHSPDLYCLVAFDGFLRRVNDACVKITGFTESELLAQPYLDFIHPDDRAACLRATEQLGTRRGAVSFEMRCRRKDGSYFWTLWSTTPMLHDRLIVATGRDITDRKVAEEAVRQSEEHYRELFHAAYEMHKNQQRLSERIIQVAEQERAKLSRDLHDEVGQALTAVSLHLGALRRELNPSQTPLRARADDALLLLEQTMTAVHRFARDLRPAMLDELGLAPALRAFVKTFGDRTGLEVTIDAEEDPDGIERLDIEKKAVVYRVVQESLNNVVKHARATAVSVTLSGSPKEITLEVKDDGCGFDLESDAERASERLGLMGMKERVRLVGGEIAILSRPGEGALVRATLPFNPT